MKRHDQGRSRPEHNVKIEPMTRVTLPSEPAPALPQWIKINEEEKKHAEHAQLHPNGSAGAQDFVLWRERTLRGAQSVVVKAIARDHQNDGDGEHPGEQHPDAMPSLCIITG